METSDFRGLAHGDLRGWHASLRRGRWGCDWADRYGETSGYGFAFPVSLRRAGAMAATPIWPRRDDGSYGCFSMLAGVFLRSISSGRRGHSPALATTRTEMSS